MQSEGNLAQGFKLSRNENMDVTCLKCDNNKINEYINAYIIRSIPGYN